MVVTGRGRRQRRSQRREGEASPPSFERFSIIVQHTLLPLDEVWRIYVACGEHPAAGGLYMFFCIPGLYPMRSCLVVLVVGTLQGLVVSLWHFGCPWTSIVAPWASTLTHMGYSWESFGHFGETLGLHFGTLGLHLGTLGVHVGVLWALWGVALDPSGHFCGKDFKKVPIESNMELQASTPR